MLREGAVLIAFVWPGQNKPLVDMLVARKATALSMDCVPRISRAQSMDALSSQALVAGYRCAIVAAGMLRRFFPLNMTAAGTVKGLIGMFAYVGAGTQDWISGLLLDTHKTMVDGKAVYDFAPAFYFWIGASVLSMLLAASAWNVRPRE